jgi:hypothetical protein
MNFILVMIDWGRMIELPKVFVERGLYRPSMSLYVTAAVDFEYTLSSWRDLGKQYDIDMAFSRNTTVDYKVDLRLNFAG